jgi:hypothetical protein
MRIALFAMLVAFSLLVAGCASPSSPPAKNITNDTQSNSTGQPGRTVNATNEVTPGDIGRNMPQANNSPTGRKGVNRSIEKPLPMQSASANNSSQAALPKVIILDNSYNDTEYGFYFEIPSGTEVITEGCRPWGGRTGCEALVQWKGSHANLAELFSDKYDFDYDFRKTLDKKGLLNRSLNATWYTADFSGRQAYIREQENTTYFERTMYLLVAGRFVGFEVNGSEGNATAAKAVWESVRFGNSLPKNYYPVEYACTVADDCRRDEICYSKSFCVGVNQSDSNINNFFNSSTACSTGGTATVCKKVCTLDSDCLKGQQCFQLRRDRGGGEVDLYSICT